MQRDLELFPGQSYPRSYYLYPLRDSPRCLDNIMKGSKRTTKVIKVEYAFELCLSIQYCFCYATSRNSNVLNDICSLQVSLVLALKQMQTLFAEDSNSISQMKCIEKKNYKIKKFLFARINKHRIWPCRILKLILHIRRNLESLIWRVSVIVKYEQFCYLRAWEDSRGLSRSCKLRNWPWLH